MKAVGGQQGGRWPGRTSAERGRGCADGQAASTRRQGRALAGGRQAGPRGRGRPEARRTLFSLRAAASAAASATSVVAGPVFFFTQRMISSLREAAGVQGRGAIRHAHR